MAMDSKRGVSMMTNTYQLKTRELLEGSVEILEMTDANGVISSVPMVAENSDYQAYLKSLEENN